MLHFDQTVGYEADVDMTLLLLVIMQRLGDHLAEQVRIAEVDVQGGWMCGGECMSSCQERPNGTL